jgi:pyruvate dehydrogenase E2 component (dihydrolipoamide acetyltransferase)
VGDVIPVGQTIAWLVQQGEAPPAVSADLPPTGRRIDDILATAVAAPAAVPSSTAGQRLSPKARRLAQEHGVDLAHVKGTGPTGEILAADILLAAKAVRPQLTGRTPEPLSSIGGLMAERTTQSWTTVPHFFVSREVEASPLIAARERLLPTVEQSHGIKLTYTDLLVAAVARALRQHPRMNASWATDGITIHPHINVALAMAVDNAVVTAVIPRADELGPGDIAAQRRAGDISRGQPSCAGTLRQRATFTVSNLGMFQVDAFTAIIVPPQAGILAVGAITNRVVVVDGEVAVRPMMTLTLSSDHRLVDGARAAMFLSTVIEALNDRHEG